jgi:hypothetical protein
MCWTGRVEVGGEEELSDVCLVGGRQQGREAAREGHGLRHPSLEFLWHRSALFQNPALVFTESKTDWLETYLV